MTGLAAKAARNMDDISHQIWDMKYRLKTPDGAPVDASIEESWARVALALNLPALNVSVGEMLDALEQVAGPAVRARVRFERDERIAGIVANWPTGASASRAARLGLKADSAFTDIIRQYIDDCRQRPDAAQTLKGLNA